MGGRHPTDRFGRVLPDGSWPAGREADGELERLRRFVNTTNLESGADLLHDGGDARAWLVREEHDDPGPLTDADAARLRVVREALRDALGTRSLEVLTPLLGPAPLAVRFDGAGTALVPAGAGLDRALAWIAATVHDAVQRGAWPRLKACANPHCRWVTYDRSKNASGTWCSTRACGARTKARAYRARRREQDHGT